ncbi:MAG: hypothetical protein MJ233_02330 [Mycoplasmoidaceae bacterium]|nr:hypothetical protein [Mycoplasmoidaceae bacterium]
MPTDVHVIINHAIIKSLAIFDGSEQTAPVVKVATPVAKPKKAVEVKPVVKENNNDMFVLSDIEIPAPKKEPKKENVEKPTEVKPKVATTFHEAPMPTDVDILLAIFSNRNAESEKQAKEILEKIKSGKLDEKAFSSAQLAKQVICASRNGIVLLFDEEIDAKLFNNAAKKKDFILSCCKIFRNPKFFVAFTKQQINGYKAQMLDAKKHPKQLLNLDALRTILNKDASIEQIAFNTIYSKLDEKDRK